MNLKKIYQSLNLSTTYQQEVERFNNRLVTVIAELDEKLETYDELYAQTYYDEEILNQLLFELGVKAPTVSRICMLFYYGDDERCLRNNIFRLLALLNVLSEHKLSPLVTHKFLRGIAHVFDKQVIDLGYTFKENTIIKTSVRELDEKLIIDVLRWLDSCPDSKEKFANALEYLLRKKWSDAVTNAYSALEGVVKFFLGSSVNLDSEKTLGALINKLSLESHWRQLLYHYCKIAHEFSSRHGKLEQNQPVAIDSEMAYFYVYITGAFLRFILQKMP